MSPLWRSEVDDAELVPPDDYKDQLDEEIRMSEESCPGCGHDFGPQIETWGKCPRCGEEL